MWSLIVEPVCLQAHGETWTTCSSKSQSVSVEEGTSSSVLETIYFIDILLGSELHPALVIQDLNPGHMRPGVVQGCTCADSLLSPVLVETLGCLKRFLLL